MCDVNGEKLDGRQRQRRRRQKVEEKKGGRPCETGWFACVLTGLRVIMLRIPTRSAFTCFLAITCTLKSSLVLLHSCFHSRALPLVLSNSHSSSHSRSLSPVLSILLNQIHKLTPVYFTNRCVFVSTMIHRLCAQVMP